MIGNLDAPLPDRMPSAAPIDRDPRVRFKHPVRVVPIGGPPRAYRVLSANLSRDGMFLKMPTPFDAGTKVALSLEAGGRVLPFAQGEVVWRHVDEPKTEGRHAGFGVRFTGFLHPRAHELVDYLVNNLETGKPLSAVPASGAWRKWLTWAGAGIAAVILGGAITSGVLRTLRDASPAPAAPPPIVLAPAVVEVPTLFDPQLEVDAAPAPAPVAPIEAAVAETEHVAQVPEVRRLGRAAPVALIEAPTKAAPPMAVTSGAVRSVAAAIAGTTLTLTLSLAPGSEIVRAFTLRAPDRLVIDVRGASPK